MNANDNFFYNLKGDFRNILKINHIFLMRFMKSLRKKDFLETYDFQESRVVLNEL